MYVNNEKFFGEFNSIFSGLLLNHLCYFLS